MSEMRACAFAFEVAICDLNCEEIAGSPVQAVGTGREKLTAGS
jgi:hypothetical protein